eukprot:sb/3474721/
MLTLFSESLYILQTYLALFLALSLFLSRLSLSSLSLFLTLSLSLCFSLSTRGEFKLKRDYKSELLQISTVPQFLSHSRDSFLEHNIFAKLTYHNKSVSFWEERLKSMTMETSVKRSFFVLREKLIKSASSSTTV